MHEIEVVLILLVAVAGLALLASRLGIPYPILLVLGGLPLGFAPGLPRVQVDPDYVFLLLLPPVLYQAALFTSWRDFRANLRPISLLAVGLVLATTCAVAAFAKLLVPSIPWAVAFVLGAIVSPPDAVAASAIAQRLRLPQRIVVILEGESLVNDATGLVAYRMAIAAVVTGAFSLSAAAGKFVVMAVGGVAVGLVVGAIAAFVRKRMRDAPVEILVSLLTPYAAYIPAELGGVSGVLAAVAAGLFVARRLPQLTTSKTRVQETAVWDMVVFVVNGLVFVLIGLQLRGVVEGLKTESPAFLVGVALAISFVVVAVRILWVYPAAALARGSLGPKEAVVVGWTGMRGVVSLAAAIALPTTTASGAPFPERDLVVFTSYVVILVTLVVQGLTLPRLILRLGVVAPAHHDEEERALLEGARAALSRLDEIRASGGAPDDVLVEARRRYELRIAQIEAAKKGAASVAAVAATVRRELDAEAVRAERRAVVELRDRGVIGDEVLHRRLQALDLEELGLRA